MECWQSLAFSWTETNSTEIKVAAFEIYLKTKLMKKRWHNFFFFFSSVPWHHENHVSFCEEKQLLDNQWHVWTENQIFCPLGWIYQATSSLTLLALEREDTTSCQQTPSVAPKAPAPSWGALAGCVCPPSPLQSPVQQPSSPCHRAEVWFCARWGVEVPLPLWWLPLEEAVTWTALAAAHAFRQALSRPIIVMF